ncbi:MAG: TonB-dependent receptor [Candidatus Kapabacteria bacterium]|nr:TonB-dependent receptor [Candidatus Kapabacteria bacterium]
MILYLTFFFFVVAVVLPSYAHTVRGRVVDAWRQPVPGATVRLDASRRGTITDRDGRFTMHGVEAPVGLRIVMVGFDTLNVTFATIPTDTVLVLRTADKQGATVVVTAQPQSERSYADRATLVDITSAEQLSQVGALHLADGLNFQPGLRMETDCRNCGFTQVRMNGLPGPYTRLLINGRPMLSALLGVYGLEQIPSVAIDRIEIMRGSGDIEGGPGAIAGSINVVTRQATAPVVSLQGQGGSMGNGVLDRTMNLYLGSTLDGLGSSSVMAFASSRSRDAYDRDGDGFSDATAVALSAGGLGTTLHLSDDHALQASAQWIREFRRGGDQLDKEPFLAGITEQLDHAIGGGTLRWLWNTGPLGLITAETGLQHTIRDSYYGGLGASPTAEDSAAARLFFGRTTDFLASANLRLDHATSLTGADESTVTAGVEALSNTVDDAMAGQGRLLTQDVRSVAAYTQLRSVGLPLGDGGMWGMQAGLRTDVLTVDGTTTFGGNATSQNRTFVAVTPRLAVDLRPNASVVWRLSYMAGFRGPQAFDEDLHVSTLNGEARIVALAPNLRPERSHAIATSIVVESEDGLGMTLDGFATVLENPFVTTLTDNRIEPSGAQIAEKRNSAGAIVGGLNAEVRFTDGSITKRPTITLQVGLTAQVAQYRAAGGEIILEGDNGPVRSTSLLRTPWLYGSWIATWAVTDRLSVTANGTATGPMLIANERLQDVRTTPWMVDAGLRTQWWPNLGLPVDVGIEAMVLNIFDVFQRDIEQGANRDGSYVYGPNRPRTVRLGLTLGKGLQ